MWKRFRSAASIGLLLTGVGCALPAPPPENQVPGAPASANAPSAGVGDPVYATAAIATEVVRTQSDAKTARATEARASAGSIVIDCSVKLPDDPTDNPELCRSFQMEVVDEAGAEAARFRFGNDARYRFFGKMGKRYRVKPIIGKNWEFTVEPNRELTIGERARVQLRQKE